MGKFEVNRSNPPAIAKRHPWPTPVPSLEAADQTVVPADAQVLPQVQAHIQTESEPGAQVGAQVRSFDFPPLEDHRPSNKRSKKIRKLEWPEILALLQVALAPILLGSVHDFVVLIHGLIAVTVLFGVVRQLSTNQPSHSPRGKSWLIKKRVWFGLTGLGLSVAVIWTGIQLVPLPQLVREALSPAATQLVSFSQVGAPNAASGGWFPLSLGWPATLLELIKYSSYLCLFLAFANGFRMGWSRRKLAITLLVTGVFITITGMGHWLWGSESWFGFYNPLHTDSSPGLRGSFINPNHQAAFLGLCTLIGIGLFTGERGWTGRRGLILTGSMICLAGSLAMVSRAAQVALITSLLLLLFLLRRKNNVQGNRSKLLIPLLAGLSFITIVFSIWIFAQPMQTEWNGTNLELNNFHSTATLDVTTTSTTIAASDPTSTSTTNSNSNSNANSNFSFSERSKLTLWKELGPSMLADYGLVGAGRGVGRAIYRQYLTHPLPGHFPYMENLYLQMGIEWGIPVSLAIIIMLVLGNIQGIRLSEPTGIKVGSFCALIFLALQNIFDFNLEFQGTAIPATALLAAVSAYQPKQKRGPKQPLGVSLPIAVPLFGLLAVVMVSGSALWLHQGNHNTATLVTKPSTDTRQLLYPAPHTLQATEEIIRRWPTDATAMRLAAWAHMQSTPPDLVRAMGMINKSLYFDPWSWESHLIVARILEHHGNNDQATIEYKLALQLAPEHTREILKQMSASPALLARRSPPAPPAPLPTPQSAPSPPSTQLPPRQDSSIYELMGMVSQTEIGLQQLAEQMSDEGRWEEASLVWEQVAVLDLNQETGFRQAVHFALKLPDPTLLVRIATNWAESAPNHWEPHRALGAGLSRDGQLQQAAASYGKAIKLYPSSLELHVARLRVLQELGNEKQLDEALSLLQIHGGNNPAWRGESYRHKAIRAEKNNNIKLALLMYRNAYQFNPTDHQIINQLGTLLERSGLAQEARSFYETAEAYLATSSNNRGNQLEQQTEQFRKTLQSRILKLGIKE